jgi:two-component sensor histidine kinase
VEKGGPNVDPPERKGFGTRLLERGLATELRGEVRIDYRPKGVVCTFDVPLGSVRSD